MADKAYQSRYTNGEDVDDALDKAAQADAKITALLSKVEELTKTVSDTADKLETAVTEINEHFGSVENKFVRIEQDINRLTAEKANASTLTDALIEMRSHTMNSHIHTSEAEKRDIAERLKALEEAISGGGDIKISTLWQAGETALRKYGATIYTSSLGEVMTLSEYVLAHPDFCTEQYDYALNYNYLVIGWGTEVLTAYTEAVELSALSEVEITYNSGATQAGIFYLVSAEGYSSETSPADYIFGKISAGECVEVPFEWLYSSDFVTTLIRLNAQAGSYFFVWKGVSDNSRPIIKSIKIRN